MQNDQKLKRLAMLLIKIGQEIADKKLIDIQ
jgi:hypothetical protein